jgi:hypothetical protein
MEVCPRLENEFPSPHNHLQNRSVGQISVKPPGEKYSDLQNSQISFINTAVLLPKGAARDRHDTRSGMWWTWMRL